MPASGSEPDSAAEFSEPANGHALESRVFESRVVALIDTALRVATIRHEVDAAALQEALESNPWVRTLKWLLPLVGSTIVVAILGGAVLGTFQIKGLIDETRDAKKEIETSRASFQSSVAEEKSSLHAFSEQATKDYNGKVNDAVQKSTADIETIIATAKTRAATDTTAKLSDLANYLTTLRTVISDRANTDWRDYASKSEPVLAASLNTGIGQIDAHIKAKLDTIDSYSSRIDDQYAAFQSTAKRAAGQLPDQIALIQQDLSKASAALAEVSASERRRTELYDVLNYAATHVSDGWLSLALWLFVARAWMPLLAIVLALPGLVLAVAAVRERFSR